MSIIWESAAMIHEIELECGGLRIDDGQIH
jgi:hypothetical protein